MALVLGVLRWQIRLDQLIRPLLKRPNARLDAEVLIALRLGAFQLIYLDRVPAHAAIDESVELTKQAGHRFASGMVNAVLRRLAVNPQFSGLPEESAENLALAQAHPAWMVERWVTFYGMETARAICRHGQAQPLLTIRLGNAAEEAELGVAGVRLEPGSLIAMARNANSGDVMATDAFRAGHVWIQDEGSQLIGEIAAASGDSERVPKNILDLCAAPGGKTLIMAERKPQAHIVACESSSRRLAELSERLAPHASRVECRQADATALGEDSTYDVVLADVPCSGTGTLGRNPEIRHRLKLEDLARQAERQRKILQTAIRAVKPGGQIVYSTCSLEPEENDQVIAAVLAEAPEARQASLESRIETLLSEGTLTSAAAQSLRACLTPEGALRLLPGALPTDGFFVALIEKPK